MRTAHLLIWLISLIVAAESSALAQTDAKQILLIQSFDQAQLTYGTLTDNIKSELSRRLKQPLNFVQFSLAPAGFRNTPEEGAVAYLRSIFAGRRAPDLIITVGAPAALFAHRHAGTLFPRLPVVMSGPDVRFIKNTPLAPNVVALAVQHDVPHMIDTILQILPDTMHLFVVVGTSEVEQSWREGIRVVSSRYPQLTFGWANPLSFAEMLKHAARLPEHSAILFGIFNIDAQGAAYDEERVLADLHAVAHAPVFGFQNSQLGRGIVGGSLMSSDALSRHTAEVAVRILNGEPPNQIAGSVQTAGLPTFDWRELRRWQVDPKRLPYSSLVLFREPTWWERGKWVVLGGGTIAVVESVLLLGLALSLRARKRIEGSLRDSEERFRLLASTAPVMIWTADADALLTDVNRPWLDFTGRSVDDELGRGWTTGVHPDDLTECLRLYMRAFERRDPFRMEYRLRRHDGEYRWILNCGVPRFAAGGALAGYIGSSVDITEQKSARAALSNLSQRLMEAQEQERARLARDLHDDVAQRLALIALELDHLSSQPSAEARSAAKELWSQCTDVLKDIQGISHRFHSPKLEYLGIASAASSLCETVSKTRGADVVFSEDRVPREIRKDVSLALFRVLQESLNNATKHSWARRVSVALRGTSHDLELLVSDDGCGFDVDAAMRGHGLGLVSMQERLKLVGGIVTIESKRGAGTTIRAVAPLRGLAVAPPVERVH
jgi:PAS domain S-box-containing protein